MGRKKQQANDYMYNMLPTLNCSIKLFLQQQKIQWWLLDYLLLVRVRALVALSVCFYVNIM